MSEGSATLAQPVRARVLAHFGGQLLLSGAVMSSVPLLVALLFGDWNSALVQCLIVLASVSYTHLTLPTNREV